MSSHAHSAVDTAHLYPHGHLGHLTPEQEKALVDFKAFITEKGLYKAGPPASHDDATLLRYLRARKWIVQDAYGQFSETEEFRKANEIDVLFETVDVSSYVHTQQLYPRYTGRRDKRGIPVYVYQIQHLDTKTVAEYEKSTGTSYSKAKTDGKTPARLLRLIALYESLTRFVQPLCSECTDREHVETPITLSTNIVDISNVSLRMFWNLKAHMQAASQLATAHYPETLDRIFIIGAPMFFSTVWGWIKRWFDPVTVSKIFVLGSHEALTVMESYIDMKNIPKAYGGELEWSFFDPPKWDDHFMSMITWENGHKTFPDGPLVWREIDDGARLECVGIGSVDGKQREERVCTIPKAIKVPKASAEAMAAAVAETSEKEAPVTNGKAVEPKVEAPVEAIEGLKITDAAKAEASEPVSEKVAAETEAVEAAPVTAQA